RTAQSCAAATTTTTTPGSTTAVAGAGAGAASGSTVTATGSGPTTGTGTGSPATTTSTPDTVPPGLARTGFQSRLAFLGGFAFALGILLECVSRVRRRRSTGVAG